MNKISTLLRNCWTAILVTCLACFAITISGIGPTWATWNIGLYGTFALLGLSTVASLVYITWASTRSFFGSSEHIAEMPTQAKPATATIREIGTARKAA